MLTTYIICLLTSPIWGNICDYRLPQWFKLGTASAAYQIEGAWNVSDKMPSIWDEFTHKYPNRIKDGSNGDVACDSYHKYERDIEMCAELGLDYYRFSINWPRLLPNGFATKISVDGRRYYDNLINGLLKRGIQPMVTIYHWELPQNLQNLGGWANPNIVDWFADYANVVFSLFGDRVKLWITINEPIVVCDISYTTEYFAPGLVEPQLGRYLCTKNLLLAHAKAYRIYEAKYKPFYRGKVSIANNCLYFGAKTDSDKELAELYMQYTCGRYLHPIYSRTGGWPSSVIKLMDTISYKAGYPRSRLPAFSKREIQLIRGSFDFFGLNYYISRTVTKLKSGEKSQGFFGSLEELPAVFGDFPNSTQGYPEMFTIYPEGLRLLLNWIRSQYGDQDIVITENGMASSKRELKDYDRINFIQRHLEQIMLCLYQDGIKVSGYTYWSLLDNMEWSSGYDPKFGLYDVDFKDKHRKRTPKLSAQYYAEVIKSRITEASKKYTKT